MGPRRCGGTSKCSREGWPCRGEQKTEPGGRFEPRRARGSPARQHAMSFQRDAALARNAPSPAAIFSFTASTSASPDALGSERAWVQTPGAPVFDAFEDNGSGNPPHNDISLDACDAIAGADPYPQPLCGEPDALSIEVSGAYNRIIVGLDFVAD